MMTFSRFHKVFINVITNIFHRSFKLILLSAVIPSRYTRICQIEKERDVAECLGVCVYLGVCTHTRAAGGRLLACQQGVTSRGITEDFYPSAPARQNSYLSLHLITPFHSFLLYPSIFFHSRICFFKF